MLVLASPDFALASASPSRQRPGRVDHPQGLRHARGGLWAGLRRAAPARRADRPEADQAAPLRLEGALAKQPGITAVVPFPSRPGAKVAIVDVFPTTSPQDAKTSTLITRLRDAVVPPFDTVRRCGSTSRATAIFDDFATVIAGKLPLFIAVIIGLGFLLLLVAFRSLVVPATAAIMNLLAAGASFGVLVAVFQWGWVHSSWGWASPARSWPSCRYCCWPSCSASPWTTRSSL